MLLGHVFFCKMAKVCDNKKYWFRFPGLYHDAQGQVKSLRACANCWYLGALNIACIQSSYCTQDKRTACFVFFRSALLPVQDVSGAAHTPFGFCYGFMLVMDTLCPLQALNLHNMSLKCVWAGYGRIRRKRSKSYTFVPHTITTMCSYNAWGSVKVWINNSESTAHSK